MFAGPVSLHISDMIDYSLRSCVERGITVRRCKNCGRWFPQTGRVSAEYCERPVASGQQTCREAGAFQQWTKKQSDDPVFKAYRKEYKKRFAWIKAGRITDEQFYAWSEQAREMKRNATGRSSPWRFKDWLKNARCRSDSGLFQNGERDLPEAGSLYSLTRRCGFDGVHMLRLSISESMTPSHRARC